MIIMRRKLLNRSRSGATTVEFALLGIPLMFVLISIFEISRGMWIYETLAQAVSDGARYAIVHGANFNAAKNSCQVKVQDIATVIKKSGVGLMPDQLTVRLQTYANFSSTTVFNDIGPSTLTTLLTDTDFFPTGTSAAPGNDVVVTGTYQFNSALAMFWPGAGKVNFASVNFGATSRERIAF
jgi:Flp pilus assembly protein TadG